MRTAAPRWVLGRIDQDTWSFTFRVNLSITPDLTVQYYGSPFIGTGRYTAFKKATDTLAQANADRFHLLGPDEIAFRAEDNSLPGHGSGGGPSYSFANPDFSFRQFRSNLVARWEWKPGSSLYVVWSQGRTAYAAGVGRLVQLELGRAPGGAARQRLPRQVQLLVFALLFWGVLRRTPQTPRALRPSESGSARSPLPISRGAASHPPDPRALRPSGPRASARRNEAASTQRGRFVIGLRAQPVALSRGAASHPPGYSASTQRRAFFPPALTAYITVSASCTSASTSAGGLAKDTEPMLAVTLEPCWLAASSTRERSLTRAVSAASRPVSGKSTTNSSPPTRPTTSVERQALRMARATATSTASPRAWPKRSLIDLKSSRST